MKKFFNIILVVVVFLLSATAVIAQTNNLHTITLENTDTGYNVILGTDRVVNVTKKTPSTNELVLELNGVTSANSVNAVYKGTNSIESLVVENLSKNRLKIYIKAPSAKSSSIIIEPIDGVTTLVGENMPTDKFLWGMFILALLGVVSKISKDIMAEDEKVFVKKDIKDREIELYRRYKSKLATTPINSKEDYQMKKIMRKIDRKIDERLTASIK